MGIGWNLHTCHILKWTKKWVEILVKIEREVMYMDLLTSTEVLSVFWLEHNEIDIFICLASGKNRMNGYIKEHIESLIGIKSKYPN